MVVVIEGGGGNEEEWNTVLWPYTLTGARTAFICMYSGAFFAFQKYRGTSADDRQINQTTAHHLSSIATPACNKYHIFFLKQQPSKDFKLLRTSAIRI
jgi:hypothetical protein